MSNDYPGKYTPPTSPTPYQPSDSPSGPYQQPAAAPAPQTPGQSQPAQAQSSPPSASQPPTGQPWGQGQQPTQPYQQPQPYPPYQQTQPYQQVQPYPQAQQPWGATPPTYPATPYSQSSVYAPEPAAPRSPMLGIIGFALVVLGLVVGIAMAVATGPAFGSIMAYVPPGASQAEIEQILYSLPEEQLQALGAAVAGPMTGLGLSSLAGIVGWILSIVAAASRRGRGWGVAGIVLGVLAPVAIFFALAFAAAATLA